DPRVGPGARRAPGTDPRLPAEAPRRAGIARRGRLGRTWHPRPRRRPHRPRPPGPRGAATDRIPRRRAAPGPGAPPGAAGAPRDPGRVVLSRPVRRLGRPDRP